MVEVPAAQAFRGVREDQGVVRRGVDFDPEALGGVLDRLEARPEDLRDAPERVRVLDPVGALVALHDLAVPEELHHVPRHEVLPDLLLQAGEPRVERRRAPAQALEAHRRRDLRVLQEPEGVRDEEASEPRHHGGAVQDRESLLRLEAEGLQARHAEGGAAWLRTRFSCNRRRSAFEIGTFSSWPNPVVTPYTGFPLRTIRRSAAWPASTRVSARWLNLTGSPPRATRTTSSTVSDSPSIASNGRPPAGDGASAIKALRGAPRHGVRPRKGS